MKARLMGERSGLRLERFLRLLVGRKPSVAGITLLLSPNEGRVLVFSKETALVFGVECKALVLFALLLLFSTGLTVLEEFPLQLVLDVFSRLKKPLD